MFLECHGSDTRISNYHVYRCSCLNSPGTSAENNIEADFYHYDLEQKKHVAVLQEENLHRIPSSDTLWSNAAISTVSAGMQFVRPVTTFGRSSACVSCQRGRSLPATGRLIANRWRRIHNMYRVKAWGPWNPPIVRCWFLVGRNNFFFPSPGLGC